jgi:hypothetical protein
MARRSDHSQDESRAMHGGPGRSAEAVGSEGGGAVDFDTLTLFRLPVSRYSPGTCPMIPNPGPNIRKADA